MNGAFVHRWIEPNWMKLMLVETDQRMHRSGCTLLLHRSGHSWIMTLEKTFNGSWFNPTWSFNKHRLSFGIGLKENFKRFYPPVYLPVTSPVQYKSEFVWLTCHRSQSSERFRFWTILEFSAKWCTNRGESIFQTAVNGVLHLNFRIKVLFC